MMSLEDKVDLKMAEKSIKHDGHRYKVAIPWKKHPGTCLLNNYSDAENRLHHIEKKLSKKSEVCKVYEETINQYLKKVGTHQTGAGGYYKRKHVPCSFPSYQNR